MGLLEGHKQQADLENVNRAPAKFTERVVDTQCVDSL